ncbi:MAG: hypothetical protein HKO60_02015 [Pseudomonadales bacterium]|nr:hypothetical protein [Pseudomonadales bacterium]
MQKRISLTLAVLALFTAACATESTYSPLANANAESVQSERERAEDADSGETLRMLEAAWQTGRDQQKPVLVVLRTDTCDRCALLSHYMSDPALRERMDTRFVVLDIDVGVAVIDSEGASSEAHLPAVVLIDSREPFDEILASDQLVTFLPSNEEPLYDWIENILQYSSQILALQ